MTEEGTIVGTVAYMSPEQAEGKKVDARSDIFSLGSVLYEMVTGQKAFQGTSKMSTLSAILHQEPKPVSGITQAIPADLERLINRCLRKDPAKRFQHMEDVKVALDELKEESDSSGLETAGVAKRKPRHSLIRALGLATALLVLLAVAGIGWWFLRPTGSPPEASLAPAPLTSYPGSERDPSFSPDGNQVAFAWNGENQDNWDIYIKLIGSESRLRLTSSPAEDRWPAWSPDGRSIAFLRYLPEGKAAVLLIPVLGGSERKLTEVLRAGWLLGSGPGLVIRRQLAGNDRQRRPLRNPAPCFCYPSRVGNSGGLPRLPRTYWPAIAIQPSPRTAALWFSPEPKTRTWAIFTF